MFQVIGKFFLIPRAESYKVYAVEHAGTAKALKAITDTVPENAGEPVTTAETTVRFTNLKPGTSYVFMIVGVNHNKVESEKALAASRSRQWRRQMKKLRHR